MTSSIETAEHDEGSETRRGECACGRERRGRSHMTAPAGRRSRVTIHLRREPRLTLTYSSYSHFVGRLLLALIGAVTLFAVSARAQNPTPPPELSVLLERSAGYIDLFVQRFSGVVAEERYVQELPPQNAAVQLRMLRRELRSDFLLVKSADSVEWAPFRDVFEVDGREVRDRSDRLTRLFLDPSVTGSSAMQQAAEIAAEGTRFNIGNLRRTVNNPMVALALFQPALRSRFHYSLGNRDRIDGTSVWTVEFRETVRPTLVRGPANSDVPAQGRYWIDADTGRVIRTEMTLIDPTVTARVTTTFEMDERLGIAVPVEMDENYRLVNGSRVLGRARYSSFRQFAVTATEVIEARF